jgi:hypothetical protein
VSELDEVLSEFLVESYENLDQLDRDLLALEEDPGLRDTQASVFRTIPTRSRAPAAFWASPPWSRSRMRARACSACCGRASWR